MTTDSHPNRRGHDLLSVERLVGLSDNVVAFALTLLVLQVTVPPCLRSPIPPRRPTWPPSSPSRPATWSAT